MITSAQARATTAYIEALPQVERVIVLDAGQCVLLIISTGGYASYMPSQDIKALDKGEATIIAGNYWHKQTFLDACKALGR